MALLSPLTVASARQDVRVPTYERTALSTGLLHVGLGAFQRAHQACYTEQLIEAGDLRWGTVGVSLRDPRVPQTLSRQDGLYSVTLRHGEQASTRIVKSLRAVWHAPSESAAVIRQIADPVTQIVTVTVTEKGYCARPASGDLDTTHPDVVHDLAHPDSPRTLLGFLAAGLARRPASAALSILSCDNMIANGRVLQRLLTQFSEQRDPGLARRVRDGIAFPCSMVDRIVPAATEASLDWASARLGLRDEAAVVCEPFTQWVLEDHFAGPRPAWEDAGVLLTHDVEPFERMKLTLLNGTHSAIAYLGQLAGLETVDQVVADAELGPFVQRLLRQDLLSSVAVPQGFDAAAYCDQLLQRFSNPSLGHRTQQIAMDGSLKLPVRWLPSLRSALQSGRVLPDLERALALWLHYLHCAQDRHGRALLISDPGAPALQHLLASHTHPLQATRACLEQAHVFGAPWPDAFVERIAGHLAVLRAAPVGVLPGW